MKRFAKHWADEMPEHPQGHWVRYDDARAIIDSLQALLNERDAELDRLRVRETGDWSWANVEWPVLEAIAREAAADHIGQHSYLEGAKSTAWQPHRWVLAAMTRAVDFAVRRSPETERHHLKNAIDRGISSGLIPVVNSVSPNSRYSAEQLEAARELREVLK